MLGQHHGSCSVTGLPKTLRSSVAQESLGGGRKGSAGSEGLSFNPQETAEASPEEMGDAAGPQRCSRGDGGIAVPALGDDACRGQPAPSSPG